MTTRARARAHAPKEKPRPTCPFGVRGHGSAYAVTFAYAVLLGMASATTPPATEHHYTSGAAVPPPMNIGDMNNTTSSTSQPRLDPGQKRPVSCSDLIDDMIRPPPNFDALVPPTATLPYADVQAVPLPAPPGAAAPTTQRVCSATRGNYGNLSNQGPSLPSLWTDRPTFAAANDGNLPASAFRTVNSAELPATGTTSGQPISLASITGTGAQATATARPPSPERNPTTTGVSPTDPDLPRPVLAGPVHPARTGAAIFSDRVSTTSPDSIRIHGSSLSIRTGQQHPVCLQVQPSRKKRSLRGGQAVLQHRLMGSGKPLQLQTAQRRRFAKTESEQVPAVYRYPPTDSDIANVLPVDVVKENTPIIEDTYQCH
jgi:hypothetical protein